LLKSADIKTTVLYANLLFAEEIGPANQFLAELVAVALPGRRMALLGRRRFPGFEPDRDA